MSDALSLFPERIEIGQFQGPDRKTVKVYCSPEFNRALSGVFERIGGAYGLDNTSLAAIAGFAPAIEGGGGAASLDAMQSDLGAQVAQLQAEATNATAQLEMVLALVGPLVQRLEALEAQLQPSPVGADWEHPGKIGAKTANTVRGTTLESTVAVGTAPLIVASTTAVANLNASLLLGGTWAIPGTIGSTTRNSGGFTTLSALSGTAVDFTTTLTGTASGSNRVQNIMAQAVGRDVHVGFGDGTSSSGRLGYYNSGDMYMWTGGVQRMTWNISGNCMLGTTTDGMTAGGSLAVAQDFAHRGTKCGFNNTAPVGPRVSGGTLAGTIAGLVALGLFAS